MKKHSVVSAVILVFFFIAGPFYTQDAALNSEEEAIKKVVVDAYITGVFNKGDASLIKKGCHPDCDVLVFSEGNLMKIPVNSYVDRIEQNPGPLMAGTTHEFTFVHVTGYAGLAIVEIFHEGKHIYTDYISLYKFEDGWKLVTKTFYSHSQNR